MTAESHSLSVSKTDTTPCLLTDETSNTARTHCPLTSKTDTSSTVPDAETTI